MGGEPSTELLHRDALEESRTRAQLRVTWTDGRGTHSIPMADRLLVGSSEEVAVSVDDRTVSRLHAELELRPSGVWVRDLGSKNGVFLDRLRVERAEVPLGAPVTMGKTVFTVTVGEGTERIPLWPEERFGPLVGRSEVMREFFMRLARYAASDATVLVQGETGTGKELVARAIHEASDRSDGPFVVVDCGALPETLLESELFGHARGAFTGAVTSRVGAIEAAHGGTLFLDEIGELPLSLQPKLLRAIEARTVRRLGETEHHPIDVRFVAATHRDLQSMVSQGAFREDLFFRLSVLPAHVPPLRARPGDIPILLEHFLGKTPPDLSRAVADEMSSYPWMGNVRELRNFADRTSVLGVPAAWALTRGTEVTRPSGAPEPAVGAAPKGSALTDGDLPRVRTDVPFKELREAWIDHLEREYVSALLKAHGHNVTAIAEAAGLDRSYVHRLLRKHDL